MNKPLTSRSVILGDSKVTIEIEARFAIASKHRYVHQLELRVRADGSWLRAGCDLHHSQFEKWSFDVLALSGDGSARISLSGAHGRALDLVVSETRAKGWSFRYRMEQIGAFATISSGLLSMSESDRVGISEWCRFLTQSAHEVGEIEQAA